MVYRRRLPRKGGDGQGGGVTASSGGIFSEDEDAGAGVNVVADGDARGERATTGTAPAPAPTSAAVGSKKAKPPPTLESHAPNMFVGIIDLTIEQLYCIYLVVIMGGKS